MITDYFDALRMIAQPIRAADLPHTLVHVTRLLDALGSPQHNYPGIVVAGSTGKGTTCLRIAQALCTPGLKVGLYTSPHLHLFRERIALLEQIEDLDTGIRQPITQRNISQREFVAAAQRVFAAQQTLDHAYSTFETTTALALTWFARQHIDLAVLEIGIGGRFDAVNAVANTLAVFTPIEAEHVAMLGGSLESVAWHKAGIIQPNGQALSVPQSPEVHAVLEREALNQHAALHFAPGSIDFIQASLSTAFPLSTQQATAGRPVLSTVSLPGRLERLPLDGHAVIIDGGHTPIAARHLLDSLGSPSSIRLIVGMLRDKNAAAYLSTFDLPNVHLVYTQPLADRALAPDELLARYTPSQASFTLVPSLDDALASAYTAPESLVIVAGSLRMAAAAREFYGLLPPEDLAESRLTRAIFAGEAYQNKLK